MAPINLFEIAKTRKIGCTASAFDLLHTGHRLMLQEARSHCDFLICFLHTDPSVQRSSKNPPVQSISERYVSLAALPEVDMVIPYATEEELLDLLKALPISVRVLGEEYRDKEFTGKNIQSITCIFNSRRHSFSTSSLRERVLSAKVSELQTIQTLAASCPKPPAATLTGN